MDRRANALGGSAPASRPRPGEQPRSHQPPSHEPDAVTRSTAWRVVLLVVGSVSLVLGLIGIVLPVLPTTPFLLVTAACYARASTRLYAWLLGQRSLGPIISEWRRSRSLPPGVKTRALMAVAITFTLSVILVDMLAVRLVLVATGVILAAFLYRIPTARPSPASVTMDLPSAQEDAP